MALVVEISNVSLEMISWEKMDGEMVVVLKKKIMKARRQEVPGRLLAAFVASPRSRLEVNASCPGVRLLVFVGHGACKSRRWGVVKGVGHENGTQPAHRHFLLRKSNIVPGIIIYV